MSRTAVAVLSTDHLLHNCKVIREKASSSKIIAMVKANAYGHGLRSVSLKLDPYVDMLGVASIDEALSLRKVGVKSPIILMQGVFEPSELLIAATEQFHIVVHSIRQAEWLEKIALPVTLSVWIKIDTGMGRLGFSPEDFDFVFAKLSNNHRIASIRILSHFACADEKDHPLNIQQNVTFEGLTLDKQNEKSLCNSAAIFNFEDCHYDWVRPGLALYGISPILGTKAAELGLKPVMTLQTNLIAVKSLKKGASIGYSATYTCSEDMEVGIATFGYGDGYPWAIPDGTPVLINGVKCPVIGRISMDMMAIDLRPCGSSNIDDSVTLWGEGLPLEEVASHIKMSPYAMLTAIQNRVRFLWTQEGSLNA